MIEFLSPEGSRISTGIAPVRTLTSLDGAVVGLLEVPFENSTLFLDTIGDVLRSEYGAADVRFYSKPSITEPTPAGQLERFADDCDVVIGAYGH